MSNKIVSPFYENLLKPNGEFIVTDVLKNKSIFRCKLNVKKSKYLDVRTIFEKLQILFNRKMLVEKFEYDYLVQLKKSIEEISNDKREEINFDSLFHEWTKKVNLDKFFLSNKSTEKKNYLCSYEKDGLREAIVEIHSDFKLDKQKLIDLFKDYDYLYFIQSGEITSAGPFIENKHFVFDNLDAIFFEKNIEKQFQDPNIASSCENFLADMTANMIIERISNYLFSRSPLHNRKIFLLDDRKVEMTEELPLT